MNAETNIPALVYESEKLSRIKGSKGVNIPDTMWWLKWARTKRGSTIMNTDRPVDLLMGASSRSTDVIAQYNTNKIKNNCKI